MFRILLIGKTGQVGFELERTLAPLGEVTAVDRRGMDLAVPDAIRRCVREAKPDLIVNAAAYTAVDKAEAEPALANAINAEAPAVLAEEAHRLNAALVYYSTDYVFDGTKDGAYVEDDPPNPLNVYGRSKLTGEQAIRDARIPHLIFRTSWIYGGRGRNFLLTILKLAAQKDELRIVDDQLGAPTWSRMIAEATAQILAQFLVPGRGDRASIAEASGVYHLTAAGRTSWCGFANAILAAASGAGNTAPAGLRVQRAVPIASSEYPTPAARPKNSVLSNEKLARTFGIALPDWRHGLRMCLANGIKP